MKVKIICNKSTTWLEGELNDQIEQLEKDGKEIIDIKYAGCDGQRNDGWGGYTTYSAMIIYKG